MKSRLLLTILGLALLIAPAAAHAHVHSTPQESIAAQTCPAIVETALDTVDAVCSLTGRNQTCYGHVELSAEAQPGVEQLIFHRAGDIANVSDVRSLRLAPLDEDSGEWGLALMRLQANLPDTLPGQNVTFILFGDVEIVNAVDRADVERGSATPMQAFYLTTGIGDSRCEEAPESGMLVQTPEGVGEVSFTVNNVSVQMGSTVLFQAQPAGEMIVSTVEGAAALTIGGEIFSVVAGTRLRVPVDLNLLPIALPGLPEAYPANLPDALPLRILERVIVPRAPFTEQELSQLRQRLSENLPLCGVDPFPTCDHLPLAAGGNPCLLLAEVQRALPALQGLPGGIQNQPERAPCEMTPISISPFDRGQFRPIVGTPDPNVMSCAIPPRPGEPPRSPDDNRPLCPFTIDASNPGVPVYYDPDAMLYQPGDQNLVPDTRDCVYPPGPNDPPLPASETRPFCPTPEPPPVFDCVVPPVPANDLRPLCPPTPTPTPGGSVNIVPPTRTPTPTPTRTGG